MTMSAWPDQQPVAIVTACMTRDGVPTFALTEVTVTAEEAANGVHYWLAEGQLVEEGYDEPFVHFDAREAPPFLHPAVRQYLGRPPAAVVVPTPVLLEEG
jgi:hypothetical protein